MSTVKNPRTDKSAAPTRERRYRFTIDSLSQNPLPRMAHCQSPSHRVQARCTPHPQSQTPLESHPPFSHNRGRGRHHSHRKALLPRLAAPVWPQCGTASTRDVSRDPPTRPSPSLAAPRARVPTSRTKLSQYCHGCGTSVKKLLSQRWHVCPCGIGPVQRDLYSAFLAAHLQSPDLPSLSCPGFLGECGDAKAEQQERLPSNVRMRGRTCPKHGYSPCRSASAQKSCQGPARVLPPRWEQQRAGAPTRASLLVSGRVSAIRPEITYNKWATWQLSVPTNGLTCLTSASRLHRSRGRSASHAPKPVPSTPVESRASHLECENSSSGMLPWYTSLS
jgi:hypothetical protein